MQQFSIWDHRGTALDYFFYPGLRVDMTRSTYINFHPYAADHVYLRPQDYAGLTKVTAISPTLLGNRRRHQLVQAI